MMSMQNQLFQVSEISISYFPKFNACERPKVNTSRQAYEILLGNWDLGKIEMQEQMKMILLNCASAVLDILEVSSGGVSGTICDPKIIFATALKANAANLILAHNHPSSSLKPSLADLNLTKKLVVCGKILDLYVLDHLIISKNRYYSFGDQGLI